MCGICGVIFADNNNKKQYIEYVENMVQTMLDRGPDHSSVSSYDNIVLGHTRLSIMDPGSKIANQPIENDRWTLVFNGEIYNFKTIRKDLEVKGYKFYSNSDTEVLLNAIDCYGVPKTLDKINGIFAFSAFNKKTKKTYLARDRIGIKPLHLHIDDDGSIYFASTPAAIALSLNKKWSLNYQSVLSFLHLGASNTLSTFFNSIEKVRPAELITINANHKMTREYYWEPKFRPGNIAHEVERVINLEKEAHVNSAVFLSGGVDSSVMAYLLKDVEGFHLASPEEKYAKYVAEFLGIKINIKEYTESVSFDDLLKTYSKSSGDASASSPIPLMVSKLISDSGFKVAFSANGADELFFGYNRTPVPGLVAKNTPATWYEPKNFETENEQILHIFRDLGAFEIPKMGRNPSQTDLMKSYSLRSISNDFPKCAKNRWFEVQTYLQGDLNPTLDFSSMAASLEVRVPFLNHELIEAALSHDSNEMLSCDYGRKTPLKKMLKKRGFNPSLWSRHKLGFSVKDDILKKRDKSLNLHLDELKKRGMFNFTNLLSIGARDKIYLKSAAHALNIWMREWVDSGKVVL